MFVTTFFWRVTAVCASSLPFVDAPVFMAICVLARIVPSECALVPMATPPADCQKTFLAIAPPLRITLVADAWVSAPATWKIHTSLGPPARVTSFDMPTLLVHL